MTINNKYTCTDCGYTCKGDDIKHSCVNFLLERLNITELLLRERQRLLDAIPECPVHGPCVPHALEWIEKAKPIDKPKLIEKIKEILEGIDKQETETSAAWWETSFGANFGANKLKEVLSAVDEL